MALSANKKLRVKVPPQRVKVKVTSGAIHIFEGAMLNFAADGGYVKLGADALSEKFAGISTEEMNIAAGDNAVEGTFEVEIIPAGSGEYVELDLNAASTLEATTKAPVFVGGDDVVKLSATNITGGMVGVVREFISSTKVLVQLTQMNHNIA